LTIGALLDQRHTALGAKQLQILSVADFDPVLMPVLSVNGIQVDDAFTSI
jgi:hypothetical protein